MDSTVFLVNETFQTAFQQAAEKEHVLAAVKYEKALVMLKHIRAEKRITPQEFECTKELLHTHFFVSAS